MDRAETGRIPAPELDAHVERALEVAAQHGLEPEILAALRRVAEGAPYRQVADELDLPPSSLHSLARTFGLTQIHLARAALRPEVLERARRRNELLELQRADRNLAEATRRGGENGTSTSRRFRA